ncbi:MAG: protein kinase [Pseudomonadota bacterium]
MIDLHASSAQTVPPGAWPGEDCLDEEQVLDLLDRRLPAHLQSRVEAHVDTCAFCRSLVSFAAQDDPALSSHNRQDPPVAAGQMIDHFMVRRFIGRGGMGEIYQAFDTTLKRRVALKLIAADLLESEEIKQRFVQEARATARFSHPNIVAIHSIGEFRGRPYLALEYIEGETLRAHLSQRQLERREILSITLGVADALYEAHRHQVLHRDLKPDNVMIGDDGRVHVLDFGLAKLRPVPIEMRSIASALSPAAPTEPSENIELCGTPAYMGPEQWRGQTVSEASDVWALGVMLFEMLAGTRPFEGPVAVDVALRVCSGETAPRLPEDLGAPAALDDLIARCLAKDATARPSAEEVAAVLRDLLGDRPARVVEQLEEAAQAWEQSGRQHSGLWDSVMVARAQQVLEHNALPLPASATRFLTTSMGQVQRLEQVRRMRLRILVAVAVGSAVLALTFAVLAVREMQRVRRSQEHAERERALALAEGASSALSRGRLLEARAKLRSAAEIQDSARTRLLWWQLESQPVLWTRTLGTGVFDVELSPDGQTVAAAGQDRTVYLIDTDTMDLRSLRGHDDQVFELAFSADSRLLASASWSGEVRLWDLAGHSVRVLGHEARHVANLAFHPTRPLLAGALADGSVRLWPLAGGDEVRTWRAETSTTHALLFSADGSRLITADAEAVNVWRFEPAERETTLELAGQGAWLSLAVDRAGTRIAAGRADGSIAIWPHPGTGPPQVLRGHGAGVHRVAFDATGTRLISASQDQSLRLWNLQDGSVSLLSSHSGWNLGLATDARRPLAVSAGSDRSVSLWQLERSALPGREQAHVDGVTAVCHTADGEHILSAGYDGTLRVWNARRGSLEETLRGPIGTVHAVDASADGSLWVSAGRDRSIWLWDVAQRTPRRNMSGHEGVISDVHFSPDGRQLASASYDGTVRTWEVSSGREMQVLRGHQGSVFTVAWTSQGQGLLSTGTDGTVRLWDLKAPHASRVLTTRAQPVRGLSVARSTGSIALASDSGQILWIAAPGQDVRILGQHEGRAYGVDIAPDGTRVASAGADGRIMLWSLSGSPGRELGRLDSEVNALRFSADGQSLVTAADDGTVRRWDVATGDSLWHAPLLWARPAALFTRQGWRILDAAPATRRESAEAWLNPVLQRSWQASLDRSEQVLCAVLDSQHLEFWRLKDGRRLFSVAVGGRGPVLARTDGCLLLRGGEVRQFSETGAEKLLRQGVSTMALSDASDDLLLVAGDQLFVHDVQGALQVTIPVDGGVTAVASRGSHVLLGYANGSVEVLDRSGGSRTRTAPVLEGTPSSAVTALAFGPMGTWMAGYSSGVVGIWDARSGALLLDAQLHGPVRHLRVDAGGVLAASELGSAIGPIDVFALPRCKFLQQIQRDIPVQWREGLVERDPSIASCP